MSILATLALVLTPSANDAFGAFKAKHGRVYESPAEELRRAQIFEENMIRAAGLSQQHPKATFGASPFADMTSEEFKQFHNLRVETTERKGDKFVVPETTAVVKKTKDWRKEGAVTPVKNQGNCGSCWAFSITGAVEGAWAAAGNTLVSLSEQFFVSCDKHDHGCNGGLPTQGIAWDDASEKGEVPTEHSYPYTSINGTVKKCVESGWSTGAHLKGYEVVGNTTAEILAALDVAPLSVAVQAELWQLYVGGVFGPWCGWGSIDHGVLLVGYTDEYWIVKNSWTEGWGEKGYIYLSREGNTCSVRDVATLAKV